MMSWCKRWTHIIIELLLIVLKVLKTPQILSPSKPPFSGPKNSKNSPISPIGPSSKVKTSLPSLDNIQIFSPIPKPTIPSKLNLDSGYNLNLSSSPIKNQTGSPQNLTYQNLPIHLKNTSSPLSRKTSSKPHSSSSSISGPSIPPGFENFISTPLKSQREKQRIKKMQKKKERRLHSSSSVLKPPSLPNSPPPLPNEGSFDSIASEIIELGLKMGMNFNGPLSDLHCKIREILIRQNQNWSSGQWKPISFHQNFQWSSSLGISEELALKSSAEFLENFSLHRTHGLFLSKSQN